MNLTSKLPDIGTTIFTVMSKMASDHGAINLSQGFPGFDCDPQLMDLVTKYMAQGKNQYAPMSGIGELREVLGAKTKLVYGQSFDSETEITIVSGATDALFTAATAILKPGDEAIILEPAYDCYAPAVVLNGAVPVYVPLNSPDFSVNWEKVASAISAKTKAIFINSPHNPGGYMLTRNDLEALADLVMGKEIYLISDEVYEHITFDGRAHLSLMTHPVLRERAFICGSFGKTFHVTGWKVGYCIAPEKLTTEFRKVHQFVTFSTATPLQYALAEYLSDSSHYLKLPAFYQKKRDLFCKGLAETAFTFEPAQGSFFQLVSYGHLSQESDVVLAERMTKETKVACIPISVFYHDGFDPKMLRFCFAKEDQELITALGRIQETSIFS